MRVLLAGAVLALLIASPVAAQTGGATVAPTGPVAPSACGELQAAPTLPDPATATREIMDAANTTYTAWSTAYHANLQCRRAESDAQRAVWQARVAEYNAGATALNERNSAWEAAVAAFNAREPEQQRRRIR